MAFYLEGAINDLRQTVEIGPGNIPVILTVPHDGSVTLFNGTELNYDKNSKKKDAHTSDLARSIYSLMDLASGAVPTVLIQRVRRQCMTPEIEGYFAHTAALSLQAMLKRHSSVLVLDLHGFSDLDSNNRPAEDVIFGTRHRQTSAGSNADLLLAQHLTSRGYLVYIPSELPKPGERFDATPEHTLMTRLSSKGFFPRAVGIQVEVAGRHRNGDLSLRQKLAEAVGDYLLGWSERGSGSFQLQL